MNEKEKSLKLAELMGWKLHLGTDYEYWSGMDKDLGGIGNYHCQSLDPYTSLAQFAAILLKFPEVMDRSTHPEIMGGTGLPFEPTQANILDEILRMKGVEVDNEE